MTDLKPEDLVGHLQILVTARRDAANGSAARVLDSADSATVTVNLSALEALLSLLADRARMEKALEPFAKASDEVFEIGKMGLSSHAELKLLAAHRVGWGDFRAARQALGASQ